MESPTRGGWNPQTRPHVRVTVSPATLLAAVPLWGVGVWFALSALGLLLDPHHRLTATFLGLGDWPWLEALAWSFSVLLPLSVLLARGMNLATGGSRVAENVTAMAILAVLTWMVWRLFAQVEGSGWYVLGFLGLAAARWMGHEGARRSTKEHFRELARAKSAFVKLYGAGVAGFLLCGLTVVPLLALGPKLDDVARQTSMMVWIGAWYFVLIGTMEIVRIEVGAKVAEGVLAADAAAAAAAERRARRAFDPVGRGM